MAASLLCSCTVTTRLRSVTVSTSALPVTFWPTVRSVASTCSGPRWKLTSAGVTVPSWGRPTAAFQALTASVVAAVNVLLMVMPSGS